MGVLSAIFEPFKIFVSTAPKPMKTIIFLLLFVTGGMLVNSIAGFFIENKYQCDSNGNLQDIEEFSTCSFKYITAYFYKWNLTKKECEQIAPSFNFNETLCEEFVKTTNQASILTRIWTAISEFPAVVYDWLTPFTGSNRTAFYEYLYNPSLALCDDLYECLSEESASELGLSDSCTFKRGWDTDDFPTLEEFKSVTIKDTNNENYGEDDTGAFGVRCFKAVKDYEPELSFFVIPIFGWRLWLLFIIFGAAYIMIVKLRSA